MNERELRRVQDDLAAMRRAAGLELPFGREDIWAHLALAVGGIVAMVWALLPHGWPAQWGMLPLMLVVIGYVVRMRIKYRRSAGRSPIRRREYTFALLGTGVAGALAVVYRIWAGKLDISLAVAGGAAFFVLGLAMLLTALRDRDRLPELGLAIPLMLSGLVIPVCPLSLWVPVGAGFAIGGLAAAVLTARQLRATRTSHVTD